jgi:DNA repair exonuclease SbcCD nuclease subunit
VKKLIVTDTHLGLYQDSDKWLDIVLQFYKDIVSYCHREQIYEIYHLGDFFDNRKSLNTKTQHTAHRIAKVLAVDPELRTNIIVGNHDCYYKNQLHPTSLELFNKYSHINIIDEPTVKDDILLVPWGGFDTVYEGSVPKYCFGHFAINGFHMNDNYVCKTGMDKASFNKFDLVLSGHFHTPSSKGNVTYLGSPYGQTFHDADDTRGFYTFDAGIEHPGNDGNPQHLLKFVEYTKAPKFKKIWTDDLEMDVGEEFKDEQINGNVVRIIFSKDYGTTKNQEFVDMVQQYNPFSCSIDFTKMRGTEEIEEDAEKIENREQMITSYIKKQTFPENIQTPILVGMFKQIMAEAEEKK